MHYNIEFCCYDYSSYQYECMSECDGSSDTDYSYVAVIVCVVAFLCVLVYGCGKLAKRSLEQNHPQNRRHVIRNVQDFHRTRSTAPSALGRTSREDYRRTVYPPSSHEHNFSVRQQSELPPDMNADLHGLPSYEEAIKQQGLMER